MQIEFQWKKVSYKLGLSKVYNYIETINKNNSLHGVDERLYIQKLLFHSALCIYAH